MTPVEFIRSILAQIWNIFESTYIPILNIPFSAVYLGALVVAVSVVILRPLLGIGVGVGHGLIRSSDKVKK